MRFKILNWMVWVRVGFLPVREGLAIALVQVGDYGGVVGISNLFGIYVTGEIYLYVRVNAAYCFSLKLEKEAHCRLNTDYSSFI